MQQQILLTNDQQAKEYGQTTGLFFFLGLDPCLHRKNGLGGWECWGRWFASCFCRVEGVIAVVISVIRLAARTRSGKKNVIVKHNQSIRKTRPRIQYASQSKQTFILLSPYYVGNLLPYGDLLLYAYFYCNEILTQLSVIKKDKMNIATLKCLFS